jgi:hypothetical protein
MCDIEEPQVQEHLQDLAYASKCGESNGWFTYAGTTTISAIITARLKLWDAVLLLLLLPPLPLPPLPAAAP